MTANDVLDIVSIVVEDMRSRLAKRAFSAQHALRFGRGREKANKEEVVGARASLDTLDILEAEIKGMMECAVVTVLVDAADVVGYGHFPGGEYRILAPSDYDAGGITAEDIVMDPLVRLIGEA